MRDVRYHHLVFVTFSNKSLEREGSDRPHEPNRNVIRRSRVDAREQSTAGMATLTPSHSENSTRSYPSFNNPSSPMTTIVPSTEDQAKFLEDALGVVKIQSFQMKRCLVMNLSPLRVPRQRNSLQRPPLYPASPRFFISPPHATMHLFRRGST